MTAYTLSVVQLCPDAYADAANAIAEASGYGPGNLSVQLLDAQGGIWWGCHAWWIPSALAAASTLPPEAPAEWHAAMAAVITRTQYGGEPLDNWQAALAENGLGVVEVPE